MTKSTAIVCDVETTGLVPEKSRVIEIAVVRWHDGAKLMRTYFDPECPIPEEITRITSITDEMVRGAPKFAERADELQQYIESAEVFIGYNPGFDKGMIAEEFKRLGRTITWPQLIDPKRLWDVYEPREERHLQNAFKRFVDRGGFAGAHGALADTNATREVMMAQIDIFGLNDTPWDEMDPERKFWFGPSAHILRKEGRLICNFGKNLGKPIVDVDVGFWRWIRERDFPDHVMMVAIKMIDFTIEVNEEIRRSAFPNEAAGLALATRLHTWADAYAKEKF